MIRGENELNIFHIKEGGDAESFPENIDEKGKVNFEAGSFPEFYASTLSCPRAAQELRLYIWL